jgi:hypothetical protein
VTLLTNATGSVRTDQRPAPASGRAVTQQLDEASVRPDCAHLRLGAGRARLRRIGDDDGPLDPVAPALQSGVAWLSVDDSAQPVPPVCESRHATAVIPIVAVLRPRARSTIVTRSRRGVSLVTRTRNVPARLTSVFWVVTVRTAPARAPAMAATIPAATKAASTADATLRRKLMA